MNKIKANMKKESNILLTVKQRLKKEIKSHVHLIEDFTKLLESYEEGDYLYFEYFNSEIGISDEEFVLYTSVLIRMGLVEKIYKMFCPCCGEISRSIYYDIKEIKTADVCEKCDCQLVGADESYKYIVVYFRVVKHEY